MNHEHHQIGAAAARLADRLPYSVTAAVAGGIALHGGMDRPHARQAILQSLPTPDFRDATADFLDLWHSCAGNLGQEYVGTDYAWLFAQKSVWTQVLAGLAEENDYDNFKSEVAHHQGRAGAAYEHWLHEVWSVMHKLQK